MNVNMHILFVSISISLMDLVSKQHQVVFEELEPTCALCNSACHMYIWPLFVTYCTCEGQLHRMFEFLTYSMKPILHRLGVWLVTGVKKRASFNSLSLPSFRFCMCGAKKTLVLCTYLAGEDKEFGRTLWVSGIRYLEKQREKREHVISERRRLLQCWCKWEKHAAKFHCLALGLKGKQLTDARSDV